MMESQKKYTLPTREVLETGYKERFLRERSGREISKSGLSSGCGDFSAVFIHELEKVGISSLFVEGAEISVRSLQFRFSGHSVVAVPFGTQLDPHYWLVDPSSRKILDRDWKLESKSFEANGATYWIGYAGSIDDYPAHNSTELQKLYDRTIKSIPLDVLENKLLKNLNKEPKQAEFTAPVAARLSADESDCKAEREALENQLEFIKDEILERYGIYTVKPGDTLAKVAKEFGTSIDKLIKTNPHIEDPTKLKVALLIRIRECK